MSGNTCVIHSGFKLNIANCFILLDPVWNDLLTARTMDSNYKFGVRSVKEVAVLPKCMNLFAKRLVLTIPLNISIFAPPQLYRTTGEATPFDLFKGTKTIAS